MVTHVDMPPTSCRTDLASSCGVQLALQCGDARLLHDGRLSGLCGGSPRVCVRLRDAGVALAQLLLQGRKFQPERCHLLEDTWSAVHSKCNDGARRLCDCVADMCQCWTAA